MLFSEKKKCCPLPFQITDLSNKPHNINKNKKQYIKKDISGLSRTSGII